MSLSEPPHSRSCLLALACAGVLLGGCGKSNLQQTSLDTPSPAHHRHETKLASAPKSIPLRLDAARAFLFARAVNLGPADVTGSKVEPRSRDPEAEHEAGKCGASGSTPVGGASSPKLDRGAGLEHETISSSVVVLSSPKQAKADFAYTSSKAGFACYARFLRKSLTGQGNADIQLGRVQLRRIQVPGPGSAPSSGIRISARVSSPQSGLSVPLYIDAVGFLYGPVEIQIYTTSFIQPEPRRTEQELLTLMGQRALRSRL